MSLKRQNGPKTNYGVLSPESHKRNISNIEGLNSEICKLQTRKNLPKEKASKYMSLNLQNITKDTPPITPWNLAKEKTLKTYELTTPKSHKRKPSKSVSLNPQKIFTAQRLQIYEIETPKSWKSVSLKRPNHTQEKTLQIFELQQNLTKDKPSHSVSLRAPKMHKKHLQKLWA